MVRVRVCVGGWDRGEGVGLAVGVERSKGEGGPGYLLFKESEGAEEERGGVQRKAEGDRLVVSQHQHLRRRWKKWWLWLWEEKI